MGSNGKPGASLRVWRDYFPNAQIIGADIDKEILFTEERIDTLWLDQLNKESIIQFWADCTSRDFDIMIDDGLHTFEAGVSLFENSINFLTKNGIYIIEDVNISDLKLFKNYFDSTGYCVDYINLLESGERLKDNSLIIIRKI
jgi:hypothetical protein